MVSQASRLCSTITEDPASRRAIAKDAPLPAKRFPIPRVFYLRVPLTSPSSFPELRIARKTKLSLNYRTRRTRRTFPVNSISMWRTRETSPPPILPHPSAPTTLPPPSSPAPTFGVEPWQAANSCKYISNRRPARFLLKMIFRSCTRYFCDQELPLDPLVNRPRDSSKKEDRVVDCRPHILARHSAWSWFPTWTGGNANILILISLMCVDTQDIDMLTCSVSEREIYTFSANVTVSIDRLYISS